MELLKFAFVLLAFLPSPSIAILGVDLSQPTSQYAFECLLNNGYSFVVVRVWQNNGIADSNAAQTIANAQTAKMAHVDGYITPCYFCGDPEGQINNMFNYIHDQGEILGTLWLDIKDPQYWSTNQTSNVNFIRTMVNALKGQEHGFGFHTWDSQWTQITGSSSEFSGYPLWYHSDGSASFDDFQSFGGWKSPTIKQFLQDFKICGVSVDANFYP